MHTTTDHIARLLKERDEKAIDLIYDNYGPNIYGYLFNMLGNASDAQDVMQDSFVKIWCHADSYEQSKSGLFSWMLSICRNTAIDCLRKKRTRRGHEIQNHKEFVYTVEQNNTDTIDILNHLDGIELKYKQIVDLLFFKGMTQQEASEALGIPLGTIKSRLRIALRELGKIYNTPGYRVGLIIMMLWMTG